MLTKVNDFRGVASLVMSNTSKTQLVQFTKQDNVN